MSSQTQKTIFIPTRIIATMITILLLLCATLTDLVHKVNGVPVTIQCLAADEVKTIDARNTPGVTVIVDSLAFPRCTFIISNSVISNVQVSLTSVTLDDTTIIMRNVTCTMPSGTKACLHFLGNVGTVVLQGPKLVSLENVTATVPSTNVGGDMSLVRVDPLKTVYKLDTFIINNCSLSVNGTLKFGGKQEVDGVRIYGTMLNVANFTVSNSNFFFGWSGSAGNFEATVVSLRGQVDCSSMQLTVANISVAYSGANSTMGCNVAGLAFKNAVSVNNIIKSILVSNMSITILRAESKTGGNGIYFHGWFWSRAAVDTTKIQIIDNSLIIPHSVISGNTPNIIDIKGFRMEKPVSTGNTQIFDFLQVSRNSIVFINTLVPSMAAANLFVTLIHFDQDLRDVNSVEFENNIITPFQFNSGASPNNLVEILHVEGVTKNLVDFSLSGCEVRLAYFTYFNSSHFGPIFFGNGVRDIVNSFKISNIYFRHDPATLPNNVDSIYSGITFRGVVTNISYNSNNNNYGGLLISNVTLAAGNNRYNSGTYSFKIVGVKFSGAVNFINNISISSFTIDKRIQVTAVTFITNLVQFDYPVATINSIAIKDSSMGTAGYQTITMFGQGFSSSLVNASTSGTSGFYSVRSVEISSCEMSHTQFKATPSLTPNVEVVFFETQMFNSIGRLVMKNNVMTINSKIGGHNQLSFKYLDFISQPMINKEGIILDGLQMIIESMMALQGITFIILHARNAMYLTPQFYGSDVFEHALIMQNFNIQMLDLNSTAADVQLASYLLLTGTQEMTAIASTGFQARSLIINNVTRFFRTNFSFDAIHRLVYIPQDYTFSQVFSITNINDTFDKCASTNGVFYAYHVQLQSIRQVEAILISNYTTDVTNGLTARSGLKFFVLGIFGAVQDNAFVMNPSSYSAALKQYSSFEVSNSKLYSSDRSLTINSTATNLRNISIVRLAYQFVGHTTGLRNISAFIINNNSIEHVRFDPSSEPRTGMFFQILFIDGSLSIEYDVQKIIITDNVIRNVSMVASKKCGAMIAAIHGGLRNPDSILNVDGDRKVTGFTAPPTIEFSGNRIVNVGPVFCAHGLFLPAALNSTDFCMYAAANVTGPTNLITIPSSFSTFGSPHFRISNNKMENISISTRLIDNIVSPTDNEASFSLFDISRCLIESYPSTVEITRNALQNIGFSQNSMTALSYENSSFSSKTFHFGAFFVRLGSIVACGGDSSGKSVAFAGGVRCSSDGNEVVGIPNSENFGPVIDISHNIFSPFGTYSNNNNNNEGDVVDSDINNNFENFRLALSTPNRTTFLYFHKDANISGNLKIEHNIVPTVNDSNAQVNLFAYGAGSAIASVMYLENSCFIRGNTTLTMSSNYQFPFTFEKTLQTVPNPLQIIFFRTNTVELPAFLLSNAHNVINKASFQFVCNHWSRLYEKPFSNISFLDRANMVNFTGCTQTKTKTRTAIPISTTTTTTTTSNLVPPTATVETLATSSSSSSTSTAVSSTTISVIIITTTPIPNSTATTPPPLTSRVAPMQSTTTSSLLQITTPLALSTTITTATSIANTTATTTTNPTAKQRTLTLSPRIPVIYTKPLVASVPATIVAAGNVASVFTGSSVVATLGVRNGLLQAQMSCANPPAPLDIGTHLTQIEIGSDQYRWWRGVLVGNSALVLGSLLLLGIVAIVQKVTKSSLVDRFLNKCVIAAGTLWLVLSGSSGIGFVALVAYAGGNSNETDQNAYSSAKNYVIAFVCGGFLLLPPLIITVIVCRFVNNNFALEAYVVAIEIEAAMKQLEKGRNETTTRTTTGETGAVDQLNVELLPSVANEQPNSPSSENNRNSNTENNNNDKDDTCSKKFFLGFLIVTEYCFAPFKGFGWPEHNRFVKRYGFLFERSSWLTFPIAELLISYFINIMIGLTQGFDVSLDFCRISSIITLVVQFLPLLFVLIVRNLLTRIDIVVTVLMSILNLVTSLLVVLKFYDVTAVADELDNPYMKAVSMLQGVVNLLATIAFLSYFVRSSIWLAARKARRSAAARRNNNDTADGNQEGDDDFIMNFIAGGRNNQTLAWADNLMRDEEVMNIIADVLIQPRSRNNEQDHVLLNDEEIDIDLDLDDIENNNNEDSNNAELDELDRLMANQNDDDDDDELGLLRTGATLTATGEAKYKRNQELEGRRLEMTKILTQKNVVDI